MKLSAVSLRNGVGEAILVVALLALFWLYVKSLRDYATKVEQLYQQQLAQQNRLEERLGELFDDE